MAEGGRDVEDGRELRSGEIVVEEESAADVGATSSELERGAE